MAPRPCALCHDARAVLKRPKTGQQICKDCFFWVFETEVHRTIVDARLFRRDDRVAIGASGGKGASASARVRGARAERPKGAPQTRRCSRT
jgi:cytoplasmic tRNA 2-thiolation protein 1